MDFSEHAFVSERQSISKPYSMRKRLCTIKGVEIFQSYKADRTPEGDPSTAKPN